MFELLDFVDNATIAIVCITVIVIVALLTGVGGESALDIGIGAIAGAGTTKAISLLRRKEEPK